MKRLLFVCLFFLLCVESAYGQSMTVREEDGSPRRGNPSQLVFPNGSLTVQGGRVHISFGGGSGTVTHTAGALTLNAFLLGNGGDDAKALALTGLVQGNGANAPTAITNSTTVGQILRVTGANAYGWGALDLADEDATTGVLPNDRLDTDIEAIAGLTSAADRLPYFTGSGTADVAVFTAFGRSLVDDADATAGRATLGLVIGTNVQAFDAELAAIAGLTSAADRLPYFTGSGTADVTVFTAFGRSLVDDADASAARTTLGLVIGTDVQGFDAELLSLAGLSYTGNAGEFIRVNATEDGFELAAISGGASAWGDLTGTLSDQTDLQSALDDKADLDSPVFTTNITTPLLIWTGAVQDLSGSGSPEGAVTAAVGSVYRRTDGGQNTSVYVKTSGSGNTGWEALLNTAAGGSGDSISVGGTGATDPNIIDSSQIDFVLDTGATPDTITANVIANSINATHIDETANYTWSGTTVISGALTMDGAETIPPTTVASFPYTVLSSDRMLAVDTSGGAGQVDLPDLGTAQAGRTITVFDAVGAALANNITIAVGGSDTFVDTTTSLVIDINFGAVTLLFTGSSATCCWKTLR